MKQGFWIIIGGFVLAEIVRFGFGAFAGRSVPPGNDREADCARFCTKSEAAIEVYRVSGYSIVCECKVPL